MGDVAGVETPLAGRQRVEGLQGVQLSQRGGRKVLELANRREGLCEREGRTKSQSKCETTNTHGRKGSKDECVNANGSGYFFLAVFPEPPLFSFFFSSSQSCSVLSA